MRHSASPTFWAAYDALPLPVQRLADANYALLKRHPRHPSLQFTQAERKHIAQDLVASQLDVARLAALRDSFDAATIPRNLVTPA